MTSFSSYLLVFFLASLILIPQGFASQPHHHPNHPPSTQEVPRHHHPKHPPSTQEFPHQGSKPHPILPTNLPKPHPHHPPKEDNTHF
ncbi:hypothetical protein MtrunA17_Chr3g0083071 [Medicago truncatula]|uniref:Transmembrane protein, putative n=1 Tax=Medicago truncatula TaxID=3880 RepID=G7IVZ7_MEDTR|nr:early nodulin-12A [Medicago truncatula]AES68831.1 transmembrane protein, putative [Medicago truncatula]RHN65726.1 hypothetical protein MtrunA17_Chr3g0083071 [Medicago truncatula]